MYGYEVKQFYINGTGFIDYAQWLYSFEQPKTINADDILFYKDFATECSL